jgi:hypothetical protein
MILIPGGKWGIASLVNTNTILLGDGIRSLAGRVASLLEGQQPKPTPTNTPSVTSTRTAQVVTKSLPL